MKSATYDKYVSEYSGPFGRARVCKVCGHTESTGLGIRQGRGFGFREGNKARGRMIRHLRNEHDIAEK